MNRQVLGKITLLLVVCASLVNGAASQEKKALEPDVFGVMHYIGEANQAPRPLARETAKVSWRGKIYRQAIAQVPGPKSAYRIREDRPLQFVMRIVPGVDPTKCELYRLGPDKNGTAREVTLEKASAFSSNNQSTRIQGTSTEPGKLQFDVSKYGESSFKFVPVNRLKPGEYFLTGTSEESYDVFTFGIDAVENTPEKSEKGS